MPAQLATLICITLIFYLFWIDRKKNKDVSPAIWIPFLWLFLAGSRYVSQWLNLAPAVESADFYSEGSPLDRVVFLSLILAGIMVLVRRRLNWNELLKDNAWIWPYFIFCAISILWSDDPFISFKRWIKFLGAVSMALIIVTEEHPYEALGVILRRLSFLLLPLSVLFIKYYPDLGRGYTISGDPMYTGVTFQKNSLGALCLISGIYFCWHLLLNHREENKSESRFHFSIYLMLLPMIAWLLYMSNSATSLACLVVAICIFILSRVPAMAQKPTRLITVGIAFLLFYGILEVLFDITKTLIAMLGRKPDLTFRVPIWEKLLAYVEDPVFGAGYAIFWSGKRMTQIWDKVGHEIINAHNGYLDTYLDLGIVGVCLLLISIIAGIRKATKCLNHEYAYAVLRITIIVVVALYNWTESGFIPLGILFVIFWVSILEPPGKEMIKH